MSILKINKGELINNLRILMSGPSPEVLQIIKDYDYPRQFLSKSNKIEENELKFLEKYWTLTKEFISAMITSSDLINPDHTASKIKAKFINKFDLLPRDDGYFRYKNYNFHLVSFTVSISLGKDGKIYPPSLSTRISRKTIEFLKTSEDDKKSNILFLLGSPDIFISLSNPVINKIISQFEAIIEDNKRPTMSVSLSGGRITISISSGILPSEHIPVDRINYFYNGFVPYESITSQQDVYYFITYCAKLLYNLGYIISNKPSLIIKKQTEIVDTSKAQIEKTKKQNHWEIKTENSKPNDKRKFKIIKTPDAIENHKAMIEFSIEDCTLKGSQDKDTKLYVLIKNHSNRSRSFRINISSSFPNNRLETAKFKIKPKTTQQYGPFFLGRANFKGKTELSVEIIDDQNFHLISEEFYVKIKRRLFRDVFEVVKFAARR